MQARRQPGLPGKIVHANGIRKRCWQDSMKRGSSTATKRIGFAEHEMESSSW